MNEKRKIAEIVDVINSGGVVLMQTDTVFGLICNGLDDTAITKIETIKQRTKPSYGFFVRDINIANMYAELSPLQEKCFKAVFPGHFTLILPANDFSKKVLPERTLGDINGQKTIGLRVPNNEFCLKVLDFFKTPLVATSANISGQKTATKFEDIEPNIIKSVDAIYHDNNNIIGISSTVVDLTKDIKIIRNGSGDINILNKIVFSEKK